MDLATKYFETASFFWGVAFMINMTMGVIMMTAIVRQTLPLWATGAVCWIGWFAFATSISLVINVVMGPNYPFSYHQMGLLLESMTNLGIVFYMVANITNNWNVRGEDWRRIEQLRQQISYERVKHATERPSDRHDKEA